MRLRSLALVPVAAAVCGGTVAGAMLHGLGAGVALTAMSSFLVALAIGTVVGLALVRRQTRGLDDLTNAVRRYAAGESGGRPRYLDDDLTPLSQAIDAAFTMAESRVAGLTRDRARTDAILGGMVEGVLVVDEVGRVQLVNAAAGRILRLDRTAVGRRYLELIRHPDIVAQISRALHGETPGGLELSLLHHESQTLIARAAPVTADGRGGAVLVLHDITDLRRADRIRRDFVANVSHELRTPLTAIQGYVEALLDATPDEGQTRKFLQIIARHSHRMERLVKDLLRLARLDAGQELLERVACPVEAVFAGVVSELSSTLAARGQLVRAEVTPEAREVLADPAKLHDILRNLVENASNYSPERSLIVLEAESDGEWWRLRVLDEGPGIPAADLSRIFERFYRVDKARSRDTGGTGLGLSIVKHLAELHGGRVVAANRPSGGAELTVLLPRLVAANGAPRDPDR
jgi:two-component system phosphate regulon sensor histidine kinase PhoR